MGKLPEGHDPNIVGVCTECHSEQRPGYLYDHPLGDKAPCKYCGGVIMVTHKKNMKRALESIDKQRGIFTSSDDSDEEV